jgi:Rrf2 family nitric oxide-sensitive transcriptional repressor
MRLTSFTDYGLRTLMRLAGALDRSFTSEEIAREFGVSRHHLVKVIRQLAEAGFVATQRGASGGIRLARAPNDITIGAVVRALEARHALVECFATDGGACTLTPTCRLKGKLAVAREAFLSDLDRTTLAECAWTPPAQRRRTP